MADEIFALLIWPLVCAIAVSVTAHIFPYMFP